LIKQRENVEVSYASMRDMSNILLNFGRKQTICLMNQTKKKFFARRLMEEFLIKKKQ